MEKAEAIHVQPNSGTTLGPAAARGFSGCIMPTMASSGPGSERLNAQLLVDSIPALIHTARPDGHLDYFNKRWLEYLGATLDKVEGWNWTNFVHPEDVKGILTKWRACLASGEVLEHETRVRRADGDYRWMFHRKVPLRDASGNIIKWYGSSLDIDERKTAEEALRNSQAYLAEAQKLSHTGSWANSPNGAPKYWSEECYRVLGFDPAEPLPTLETIFQRIHQDDRAAMREQLERGIRDKTDFEVDMRIVHPNTGIRNIRSICHAVVDARGDLREMVGTVIDITEHRRAEEAIRRSEAYLAEAQRLSHTGSFGWRPDTGEIVWSDETYRTFEYDGSVKPTIDSVVQRVHPEDRADVREVIDRAFAGATDFEHAYRLLLPDGRVKHVHAIAHALQDAPGSREFVGAVTDVTTAKQAEENVRQSEMELRQILDFAPWQVAVLGADGKAMFLNKAGLDYHGLTREAWQTSDPNTLIHPDDHDRILTGAGQAKLLGDQPFEIEARLVRKDGKYRWFLFRFNPLRDGEGRVTRWYVGAADIEDRKQTEERLQIENVALREEIDKASMFEEIVGTSPALQTVLSRISKVAPSDSTVLITGETGTGKELVARAIHRRSNRVSRPFVGVNCAGIPRDLIASELFGHEKGAFTGATQQRLGRFELANGGTIFLDEVGELPVDTQIALLRVLQEHEFERVGGTRLIRADVRVITATNRDLQAAISAGSFRSDLFYRLHVFPIEIPALRERKEDIRLLVEYFIDRYARKAGKIIKRVNKRTLELLQSYPWPGNIRELQNVIERSVILCDTEIFSIDENWLPQSPPLTPESKQQVELPRRLLAQEKEIIEAALKECRGRIFGPTGAAAKLGIPRSTLESKIRSLKINKNRFRSAG
jgi:PAS domain S-box-containing protein